MHLLRAPRTDPRANLASGGDRRPAKLPPMQGKHSEVVRFKHESAAPAQRVQRRAGSPPGPAGPHVARRPVPLCVRAAGVLRPDGCSGRPAAAGRTLPGSRRRRRGPLPSRVLGLDLHVRAAKLRFREPVTARTCGPSASPRASGRRVTGPTPGGPEPTPRRAERTSRREAGCGGAGAGRERSRAEVAEHGRRDKKHRADAEKNRADAAERRAEVAGGNWRTSGRAFGSS